jgi:hypothetical protein
LRLRRWWISLFWRYVSRQDIISYATGWVHTWKGWKLDVKGRERKDLYFEVLKKILVTCSDINYARLWVLLVLGPSPCSVFRCRWFLVFFDVEWPCRYIVSNARCALAIDTSLFLNSPPLSAWRLQWIFRTPTRNTKILVTKADAIHFQKQTQEQWPPKLNNATVPVGWAERIKWCFRTTFILLWTR